MKTSEIKFTITLDENKLPIGIQWESTDNLEKGDCKAVMLSMWDKNEQNTLRIDLWTKDFMIDEMKQFFHQNLLSMASTFQRATGEDNVIDDLRDYAEHFAKEMNITPQK